MQSLDVLPRDLPRPVDDGACNHLHQQKLPQIALFSSEGEWVNPAGISGWLVLYFYPMTGRPGVALPDGWNAIPGARGCTPQSCAFRDHYQELRALNAEVFGVSTQAPAEQKEAAARLHLPFPLLSDERYGFINALRLPVFQVGDLTLNKRVTLIIRDGIIQHYYYPVFPPDRNCDAVLAWLARQ